MSWLTEFREAWESYPSQDNEGYLPDRAGFKCGYGSAWHKQQQRIYEKDAEIAQLKSQLEAMKKYRDAYPKNQEEIAQLEQQLRDAKKLSDADWERFRSESEKYKQLTDSQEKSIISLAEQRHELEEKLAGYEKSGATQFLNQQILELREQRAGLTKMLEEARSDFKKLNAASLDKIIECDKWKEEYENVCKFATDYEQQRDQLRTQLRDAEKVLRVLADPHSGKDWMEESRMAKAYFTKHPPSAGGETSK